MALEGFADSSVSSSLSSEDGELLDPVNAAEGERGTGIRCEVEEYECTASGDGEVADLPPLLRRNGEAGEPGLRLARFGDTPRGDKCESSRIDIDRVMIRGEGGTDPLRTARGEDGAAAKIATGEGGTDRRHASIGDKTACSIAD